MKSTSLITRRRFIKNSGGATLGTVLGIGLLPSITRKLCAQDSSTHYGGIKWTDTLANHDTAHATIYGPNEDTVYHAQSYTTQNITDGPYHGTLEVIRSIATDIIPGMCASRIRIEAITQMTITMTMILFNQIVKYQGGFSVRTVKYMECIGGIISETSSYTYRSDDNGDHVFVTKISHGTGVSDDADNYYPANGVAEEVEVNAAGNGVRLKPISGTPPAFTPVATGGYTVQCCSL